MHDQHPIVVVSRGTEMGIVRGGCRGPGQPLVSTFDGPFDGFDGGGRRRLQFDGFDRGARRRLQFDGFYGLWRDVRDARRNTKTHSFHRAQSRTHRQPPIFNVLILGVSLLLRPVCPACSKILDCAIRATQQNLRLLHAQRSKI